MVGLLEVEGHSGLRGKGGGTGAAVELEATRRGEPSVNVPALGALRGGLISGAGARALEAAASDRGGVLAGSHGLFAARTAGSTETRVALTTGTAGVRRG